MQHLHEKMARIFLMTIWIFASLAALSMAATIQVDINGAGCVTGTGQADPTAVVYCNLPDAVFDAAAGDTIMVAAGSYAFASLTIDKALTIDGGGVAALSNALSITASDVTLTGLTFNGNGNEVQIRIDSAASALDNITISDNIFNLMNGDVGIDLGGLSATNFAITTVTISGNTFNGPIDRISNPLRVGGFFGGGDLDVAISGLSFVQNTVIRGSIPINLRDENLTDLYFGQNDFSDTDGVLYLWTESGAPTGTLSQFDFSENFVDNTASSSYALGFDLFDRYSDANFGADNQVTHNSFVGVNPQYGFDTITFLSTGLTNTLLNAELNWFGSNNPTDVTAAVSSQVDYSPWLRSSTDADGAVGFQGDLTALGVDSDSPSAVVADPGNLQDGFDTVATNGTLYMTGGNYGESLTIDRPVTLQGDGSSSSIIDGFGIQITAGGTMANPLEILDVQVTNSPGYGVQIVGDIDYVHIRDCSFVSNDIGLELDSDFATTWEDVSVNCSVIAGNTTAGVYFVDNIFGSLIDLQGNWWGDPSGPGDLGGGSGDAISAGAGVTPNFDANPYVAVDFADVDLDGDGYWDVTTCDNCPETTNVDQTDSDGDSVGDACDACPGFDDLADEDNDGTPDGCDTPIAASNLQITAITHEQVDLSWDDNSGLETGYRIERDAGSGFLNYAQVGSNVTTFVDGTVDPITEYCYRVVAYNGNGDAASTSDVCATTPFTPVQLANLAASAGVEFLESTRGVAWGDADGDLDEDLAVANDDDDSQLFLNDFDTHTFFDLSLLLPGGQGFCPVWGDYDNDGDLDLFLGMNNVPNHFYRNDGGTFTEIAAQIGLDDEGSARGAAWADYDLDGDIDLYLCRVSSEPNRLYRNDFGVFTDVAAAVTPPRRAGDFSRSFEMSSKEVNVSTQTEMATQKAAVRAEDIPFARNVADTNSNSQSCAWADYDNDGDPDLYVANWGQANRLYRNDNGLFTDVAAALNVDGAPDNSQGCAWFDYNNDGWLDLFVANILTTDNRLYLNNNGTFNDVAATAFVGGTGDSKVPAWADVDNDTWPDLYVGIRNSDHADHLFMNQGGFFVDQASQLGLVNDHATSGAAWGDYDGNGYLDLYVGNLMQNQLFHNSGTENHWLHVRVHGDGSNQSAIGARVRIVQGALSQIREVEGGSGYLSQNSLPIEFGLGQVTTIDSVIVEFPGGNTVVLENVSPDQMLDIHENDTTAPADITDLQVTNTEYNQLTIAWTAPGDNGNWGSADLYDIRWSLNPITVGNWNAATPVNDEPTPGPAFSTETYTLTGLETFTQYYIGLVAIDESGNETALATTQAQTELNPFFITGTVYDDDTNQPLPDIVVQIWDDYPDGTIIESTMTDANGDYLVDELIDGGFYDVRAHSTEAAGYPYFPGLLEDVQVPASAADFYLSPTPTFEPNANFCQFLCENGSVFEGAPLQDGDVVTAYDPRGTLCGISEEAGDGNFSMFVYGDDPFTENIIEGPGDGEVVSFRVNDNPAQILSGSPTYQNLGVKNVCLTSSFAAVMTLPLSGTGSGWNLISWNIDTVEDSTHLFFGDVMDNVVVILGFEEGALSYRPDLPPQFSNLDEVDHLHGYWLKMTQDDTLYVTGTQAFAQSPIELEAGWNLASYLPTAPDSIAHALDSIYPILTKVLGFDQGALSFYTDPVIQPFSNLWTMHPGFGYWIHVTNPGTLIYPETQLPIPLMTRTADTPVADALNRATPITPTRQWMDIYGQDLTLNGEKLPTGTRIEAVDEDGVVCGQAMVSTAGQFGLMAVYADDPLTEVDEGVTPDGAFTLRLILADASTPLDLDTTLQWTDFGDVHAVQFNLWTDDAGHISHTPLAFDLKQNIPNPFNPTTTIRFDLPQAAQVSLRIYNAAGQRVQRLSEQQTYAAGQHELQWNGRNANGEQVGSGIYFYRLEAQAQGDVFVDQKRMILLK